MNKNSTNNSNCKVISKYFSSSPVMDESLSDFQEKKPKVAGPKISQKTVSQSKGRKLPKRAKGQKDIQTVLKSLKSKKNDLLTYTKEFDEVCKLSGVDVDPEQLQLAVALSKSLQPDTDSCDSQNCPSTSSRDRTGKIRSTLLEYGFTVPEIKIPTKKKLHKRKKNYKLLLSTHTEKQQIISDKYTQVLFQNICNHIDNNDSLDYVDRRLYHLATNTKYNAIKNNDELYVNGLIERSYTTGNLLRDWSEIPGRPVSPKLCEPYTMNMSEIECSQEELDVILSGTLKCAKDIVKKKLETKSVATTINIVEHKFENVAEKTDGNKINFINFDHENKVIDLEVENTSTKPAGSKSESLLALACETIRSCSPDLFDDEQSVFLENNETGTYAIYQELINSISEDKAVLKENEMDLTQSETMEVKDLSRSNCQTTPKQNQMNTVVLLEENKFNTKVASKSNVSHNLQIPEVSQCTDKTKRISDDMMEITKCVATTSTRVLTDANYQMFYLTESPPSQPSITDPTNSKVNKSKTLSNDLMEITNCVAHGPINKLKNIEADIDHSQNSDKYNKAVVEGGANSCINLVDLLDSSNSGDELPSIQISGTNKSLDDTIILDNEEITDALVKPKPVQQESFNEEDKTAADNYDLTQSPLSSEKENNLIPQFNQSFYDDYQYDHSDDITHETIEKSVQSDSKNSAEDNEVDLTQTSNSSDDIKGSNIRETKTIVSDANNLGKKDNVSIDYDELLNVENIVENNVTSRAIECQQSIVYDDVDNIIKETSKTSSKNSEIFEICDQELDYSLNKSRQDVRWDNFGGISVMDNISRVEKCRFSENNINRQSVDSHNTMHKSMTDSFLPMVDIKIPFNNENNESSSSDTLTTPCKEFSKEKAAVIQTPGSNEYIVKIDQVTPMLDYASMSTPERNKELEKYGLKPFKRKRAVQLLTHLYNQTHPVVESLSEDCASPSKKRKPNQTSPKHLDKSPLEEPETIESNKENDIYEVTNECPQIKDIHCLEEDWVFQKREKAKVHSCRVPLHIAFHNYVTCRRRLREAILRYEPVNIDVIHKELIANGYRYDPKDLLKFMDKKCITVKTADNNARNKRY